MASRFVPPDSVAIYTKFFRYSGISQLCRPEERADEAFPYPTVAIEIMATIRASELLNRGFIYHNMLHNSGKSSKRKGKQIFNT